MFDKVVTIFNRQGNKWYPRICEGVFFSNSSAYIQRNFGTTDNANVAVHFPLRDGEISGNLYVKPKAWKELVDKTGKITAKGGEEYDIILLERWSDESVVDDNDYPKGFYHYLRENNDGVHAVTMVSEFQTIPHIEVAAT